MAFAFLPPVDAKSRFFLSDLPAPEGWGSGWLWINPSAVPERSAAWRSFSFCKYIGKPLSYLFFETNVGQSLFIHDVLLIVLQDNIKYQNYCSIERKKAIKRICITESWRKSNNDTQICWNDFWKGFTYLQNAINIKKGSSHP